MNAAAELFMEKGFEAASVRDITSRAGVNLAAVNYHFGSRQALIHAVADRYLQPLCRDLELQLDDCLSHDSDPELEDLLELLVSSTLRAVEPDGSGVNLFMRLLGYAYSEVSGELRHYLLEQYAGTFSRFLGLLRERGSKLSDNEFFWRCHFLLSACFLPLSNHAILTEIEEARFGGASAVEIVLHRLIPVLAAGLRAEPDRVSEKPEQLW
nr:TetR/AcrR family transcriptional regulator [Motiliproteus sp. SC1-56]